MLQAQLCSSDVQGASGVALRQPGGRRLWGSEGASGAGEADAGDVEAGAAAWGEGKRWHLPLSHPSRKMLCCSELPAVTSRGFPAQPQPWYVADACQPGLPGCSCSAPIKCLVLWVGVEIFSFPGALASKFPTCFHCYAQKYSVPNAWAGNRLNPPVLCWSLEGRVSLGASRGR